MRRALATTTCLAALAVLLAASVAEAGTAQTMRYMPADTEAYVSGNVAALKRSPLGKFLIEALNSDASVKRDIGKLAKATGFDPRRDVSAFTVFVPGATLGGGKQEFLVVAEGRFNQKRIEAFIRKESKSVRVAKFSGRRVLILDDEGALAFEGKVALLGTIPQVKAGLKNRATGGRVSARLAKLGKQRGDMFGAIRVPPAMRQQMGRDLPPAKDLIGASFSLKSSATLAMRARMLFTNAKVANQVTQMAIGMQSEVTKDAMVQSIGLVEEIRTAKISQAGSSVKVEAQMGAAKLIGLLKQMGGLP